MSKQAYFKVKKSPLRITVVVYSSYLMKNSISKSDIIKKTQSQVKTCIQEMAPPTQLLYHLASSQTQYISVEAAHSFSSELSNDKLKQWRNGSKGLPKKTSKPTYYFHTARNRGNCCKEHCFNALLHFMIFRLDVAVEKPFGSC